MSDLDWVGLINRAKYLDAGLDIIMREARLVTGVDAIRAHMKKLLVAEEQAKAIAKAVTKRRLKFRWEKNARHLP